MLDKIDKIRQHSRWLRRGATFSLWLLQTYFAAETRTRLSSGFKMMPLTANSVAAAKTRPSYRTWKPFFL